MKSNFILKYWEKLILIALLVIVLSSFNTKDGNNENLYQQSEYGHFIAMPLKNNNSGTASFAVFDTQLGNFICTYEITPEGVKTTGYYGEGYKFSH